MSNLVVFILHQKLNTFREESIYILNVAGLNTEEEITYILNYYYLIYLVGLPYLI